MIIQTSVEKRRFNANITVHTNKLIAKNVPYAKGSLNNNLLNCDSNFHKKRNKNTDRNVFIMSVKFGTYECI